MSKPIQHRFFFVDIARSVAILLMLEGHFVDLAIDHSTIVHKNIGWSIWFFIRGLSAPLFFVVSGLVFVYLLSKSIDKDLRIKKGLKRGVQLILIGYTLQFNLFNYKNYINGTFEDWVFAFHVLQSIGFGLLFLILVYKVYVYLNFGALYIYYLIAGILIYLVYIMFNFFDVEDHFVNGAQLIQNIIRGKNGLFSLFPWLSLVFFGGMIGDLMSQFKEVFKRKNFYLVLILSGVIINLICILLKNISDNVLFDPFYSTTVLFIIERFGQVLVLLAFFMKLEKWVNSKSIFIKMGQNTLFIYVTHVVLLYGGFVGVGLKDVLKNKLNGVEVIIGLIIFILSFFLMVKYLHYFKVRKEIKRY